MFTKQVHALDEYQLRHAWLGFPMAVFKKFGEDQGGNLAAVLSYYAFFSLFPLLLVFFTIVGFVLQGNEALRTRLANGVGSEFSFIDASIIKGMQGSVVVLVVGVLLALYSGLAVANAAQSAFNGVYDVAFVDRPDFFHRLIRSVVIVGVGFLLLSTTVVAGFVTAPRGDGTHVALGPRVIGGVIAALLDVGLFVFLFRWLTARPVSWRQALPGAVLGAIIFVILQGAATALLTHYTKGASKTYGAFATVIGVLSWFYLQARFTLLCAEVNVVRQFRLWPRALQQPPGTRADARAYEMQAEENRFQRGQRVDLNYPPQAGADGEGAGKGAPQAPAVHSDPPIHTGKVVGLVATVALAAWVHGRRTARPSAGERHEHQSRNVGR